MKLNRLKFKRNPASLVAQSRAQIEREFSFLNKEQSRVFRLVLNEAEALAWESDFPHLFFPALAAEKLEALSAWHRRQNAIRQASPSLAFAA